MIKNKILVLQYDISLCNKVVKSFVKVSTVECIEIKYISLKISIKYLKFLTFFKYNKTCFDTLLSFF